VSAHSTVVLEGAVDWITTPLGALDHEGAAPVPPEYKTWPLDPADPFAWSSDVTFSPESICLVTS